MALDQYQRRLKLTLEDARPSLTTRRANSKTEPPETSVKQQLEAFGQFIARHGGRA
jgi:hypothetical protein